MEENNTPKESTFNKVRNHLSAHKGTYIASGIAVTLFALMQRSHGQFDKFLVEKGIDPMEYWNPEYHAELQENN